MPDLGHRLVDDGRPFRLVVCHMDCTATHDRSPAGAGA